MKKDIFSAGLLICMALVFIAINGCGEINRKSDAGGAVPGEASTLRAANSYLETGQIILDIGNIGAIDLGANQQMGNNGNGNMKEKNKNKKFNPPTMTENILPYPINLYQEWNPGKSADEPRAMAFDGTSIYLVGFDTIANRKDAEWHIEKRNFQTGKRDPNFNGGMDIISNPSFRWEMAYGIAIDLTDMYIVGTDINPGPTDCQWRIEKRNLITGQFNNNFGNGGVVNDNPTALDDESLAIATDGQHLYIAGITLLDPIQPDYAWLIEKRDAQNGSLVNTFGVGGRIQTNPTMLMDIAYAITIDGDYIYIAGYDNYDPLVGRDSDARWRVEKRNKSDGKLVQQFGNQGILTINPMAKSDFLSTIKVDASSIYLAGCSYAQYLNANGQQWRIEKRNKDNGLPDNAFGNGGVILNPASYNQKAMAMTLDNDYMYLVGYYSDDFDPYIDTVWHIEKRALVSGAIDKKFALNGEFNLNMSRTQDFLVGVAVDGRNLRAVGVETLPHDKWATNDSEWALIGMAK